MRLLTKDEMQSVAAAIAEVEKKTDAELIAVWVRQSAHYATLTTLWAAVIALAVPALLLMFLPALHQWHVLLLQWLLFGALALVFRWKPTQFLLCPKSLAHWHASNLARRQFLEQNLHATQQGTGVLIFVSEQERFVEIIADRGISEHIDSAQWQSIIDHLTERVRRKETLNGFLECIHTCGELLAQHVPITHAKNELPNHLIVIE